MKYVNYSKYKGDPFDGLSSEDLLEMLQDFLLDSGFYSQFSEFYEMDPEKTMEQLRQAILNALHDKGMIPGDLLKEFLDNPEEYEQSKLHDLIEQLIQRLDQEGYVTIDQPHQPDGARPRLEEQGAGRSGDREGKVKFEVTDKALDFLGFKTLKDLLGSLGKSSFGRHDTRELATGVESGGATRRYEFGDTMNLDVNATLLSSIRRAGLKMPLDLDYEDLQVHQCEYQSSCATVLMLDCSHSMILYGEDRFTPAKKVALALTHLIRAQYPGDTLHMVLFHDSAEEIPLGQLARAQVGPYYTNTREGLRMAQRILSRQKKDMRQIVMITDGKPSALTLEDGRIYKNAFGLDPLVVSETLHEVARCRRNGVLINTFMLASDYGLVNFVQKVTEICRGKAYFTTPYTLGQYLLMDYMQKKVKHIH
ncbi:MAG: VWA domain-containing protein [Acidobacteriota bacterium]|nr:VWA domain-containing protein [Acidobacteriota bacterium]